MTRSVDRQTILVTGATDGLGKALARELAARGATVLVHGRSGTRLEETMREFSGATGSDRVRPLRADFASLAEVRRLAAEVERTQARLDVLVNNAGIGAGRRREVREESAGHEDGPRILRRPDEQGRRGVEATLRLAVSPELEGVSGRYFDRLREARAHEQAYDATARRRLWRLSEELARAGPARS